MDTGFDGKSIILKHAICEAQFNGHDDFCEVKGVHEIFFFFFCIKEISEQMSNFVTTQQQYAYNG